MPRPTGWIVDLCLVVACALIAMSLQQDANWDQLQYHYWYPWQLFHGGFTDPDLFGGRFQNPLPQVPFYLAAATLPPVAAQGLMGTLAGVCLVLVRRIALRTLPYTGRAGLLISVLAALLGVGAAFRSEIGSSYSDVLLTGLLLGALLLVLRGQPMAAGVLAGAAAGAKFTAAPFTVAVLAALLCLPGTRLRRSGLWVAGAVAGAAVTGGWWAWSMWRIYDSPVFPYWNPVFGSPWFPDRTLTDERYGVHSVAGAIRLPWDLATGSAAVLDLPVRDPRWLILVCAGVVAALVWRGRSRPRSDAAAVVVFVLVGWMLWLAVFGVIRYAIPAEVLAGLLIVYALTAILAARVAAVAGSTMVLIVLTGLLTQSAATRRVSFGDQWWTVDRAALRVVGPRDAVLVDGQYPSTFVLPDALPDGTAVHVVQKDFLGTPLQDWLMQELARADRLWVITDARGPSQVDGAVVQIDYSGCQRISTNVVPRWVCPASL